MTTSSINKVFLIGRVGTDAKLRYMPSGTAILQLKIVTMEVHTGKDKYHSKETEWHSVDYFGDQAELIYEVCHKGDLVQIDGSIRTRKFKDKRTGQDRYSTEIIGHEFNLIKKSKPHSQQRSHEQVSHLRGELEKMKRKNDLVAEDGAD